MYSIMRHTTNKSFRHRSILYAAAFSSISGASWAFTPPLHPIRTAKAMHHPTLLRQQQLRQQQQQSRLFFSQRNDNDDDWATFKKAGSNLFKKGVDKVKSIIPFGKSDEEKRAKMIKKERKQEITGGISEMLKDAPLPIRMMGRMVSPLLARAAEEIAEQSKEAQYMWEEARIRLMNDPYISEALGEPLQIGQPFSQAQSTTVINGKSSARVQASFQVAGPRGSGVATLESVNGEIRSLNVNVNGRNISVGSSTRGGNAIYGKSSSSKKDDNIVEAEIIEKK